MSLSCFIGLSALTPAAPSASLRATAASSVINQATVSSLDMESCLTRIHSIASVSWLERFKTPSACLM